MALHPDQAAVNVWDANDYNTGRKKWIADINVTDRVGSEPHSIRAQAEQINSRDWMVRVVHGPHEERDESGSYYRTVGSEMVHDATPAKMKTHVRRAAKSAHNDMLKQRPR